MIRLPRENYGLYYGNGEEANVINIYASYLHFDIYSIDRIVLRGNPQTISSSYNC
jgi:hypothetical protein